MLVNFKQLKSSFKSGFLKVQFSSWNFSISIILNTLRSMESTQVVQRCSSPSNYQLYNSSAPPSDHQIMSYCNKQFVWTMSVILSSTCLRCISCCSSSGFMNILWVLFLFDLSSNLSMRKLMLSLKSASLFRMHESWGYMLFRGVVFNFSANLSFHVVNINICKF